MYTRKARKSRRNRRVRKTRRGGGILNSITGLFSKKKTPLSSVAPLEPVRRHSNTSVNYGIMNSPNAAYEPGYINKLAKMKKNQNEVHAAATAAKNMSGVSKSF